MRWRALVLFSVALACGGDQDAEPAGGGGGGGGSASSCGVDEISRSDGSCVPVGVTAIGCAAGFEVSDDAGCEPILPTDPCGDGLVAWLGETQCHEIAPCGTGAWGDIPIEPGSQHVDGAYLGGDSDGSSSKPWLTISDGIAAADAGAIVAVAAGTYPEYVHVVGKPVRLWGRCPAMVEIVGQQASLFGVDVEVGGSGTEIHNLSVRGDVFGISISGAEDVLVDSVWIHDTDNYAFDIEDVLGPSSVVVRNMLIERAALAGFFVSEALVDAENVVVRHTRPSATGDYGRGINIEGENGGAPVTIKGCVVQHSYGAGVFVEYEPLTLERCLIEDTAPQENSGAFGRGISAQQATLTVRSSVVRHNVDQGLLIADGSVAVIERTVIRDTISNADLRHGIGIGLQHSELALRDSLILRNHDFGVAVMSAIAVVERTIVRQTAVAADGIFGDGMVVVPIEAQGVNRLSIADVIVDASARAGIANFGAEVTIGGSRLSCNAFHLNGEDVGPLSFSFVDLGENVCRCDELEPCAVQTVALEPPAALQ